LQGRLLNVSRLATIGELTSGIAHEINQPLCAVANYAQACNRLLSQPNPDIPGIREALENITSQALRAADVIRRLRVLAAPSKPRQKPTDVNVLLRRMTDLIQAEASYYQVQFQLEPGDQLPRVCVDRAQIQQVIVNLVRNAIEALADIPAASRNITIRTLREDNGGVEICVCDSGVGVSESVVPHLFMPFYSSKTAGTGLGLAMSRTLARANAGALHYRPNSPVGSCFSLMLPGVLRNTNTLESDRPEDVENT
jgi:C4-dicarboxylate-specific signal transduction histidine kinase